MNVPSDPAESYRGVIDARQPFDQGGGACTLLVLRLRIGGRHRVRLLHHAALQTSAELTLTEALDLAAMLTTAATPGDPRDR